MKTRSQTREQRERTPSLGQKMALESRTPLGLFEANNGDRFIICDDPHYGSCAIVLRSGCYSQYSWRRLSRRPLLGGRWWGPYRVKFTESYESSDQPLESGTMYLFERYIGLECRKGDEKHFMTLGTTNAAKTDRRDAEGWTIEAARVGFIFCKRSSDGRINCAPAPRTVITKWDQEDFIEVVSPWVTS